MKTSGKRRAHWIDPKIPRSHDALLVIDAINDLDFPGGAALRRTAIPAARKIAALKKRARAARVPVIYVNDNFGRWRSDFRQQIAHCLRDGCPGRELVELLHPDEDDYFVLKPMHSGFYSTTLEVLLDRLGVQRLVLTGFAADLCVLYTANDAHMRDFEIVVPRDGIAAETPARKRFAIQHIGNQLSAKVPMASDVRFRRGTGGASSGSHR